MELSSMSRFIALITLFLTGVIASASLTVTYAQIDPTEQQATVDALVEARFTQTGEYGLTQTAVIEATVDAAFNQALTNTAMPPTSTPPPPTTRPTLNPSPTIDRRAGNYPFIKNLNLGYTTHIEWMADGVSLLTLSSIDGFIIHEDLNFTKRRRVASDDGFSIFTAISPDGNYAASGVDNITVLNLQTGRREHTLTGQSFLLAAITFSPDSKTLATTDGLGEVFLWDVATGEELAVITDEIGINGIAFSPDNTLLALSYRGGKIKLWNVVNPERPQELRPLTPEARRSGFSLTPITRSIAFSPDSNLVAVIGDPMTGDMTVATMWNIAQRRKVATLEGHRDGITSLSFSYDGTVLATSSEDTTVRIWDVQAGAQLSVLDRHTTSVVDVTFSPTRRMLASLGRLDEVFIWGSQIAPIVPTATPTLEATTTPQRVTTTPTRTRAALGPEAFQQAVEDYDAVIKGGDKSAVAYVGRGNGYYGLYQNGLALIDYKNALALEPDNVEALLGRGGIYLRLEQYDLAMDDFMRVLELDPENPIALARRGYVYFLRGDVEAAARDYEQAIEIDHTLAEVYLYRGSLYFREGEESETLRNYNLAIQLAPYESQGYFLRGLFYRWYNDGDHTPAIADFTRAIELRPNYKEAYFARAVSYEQLKQYDKAAEDLTRYIEIDSNDFRGYLIRAFYYYMMEEYELAVVDAQQAARLNPEDTTVYLLLGDIHYELRQFEQALTAYWKHMASDSNWTGPETLERIAELEARLGITPTPPGI
jgi:tetratricopeptide (TPR) repeat protein